MRVLVVTAMYPSVEKPASGIFVKEQVTSLREAGIDVDVFAFEGKGSAKNYLKAGIRLREIVSREPYDLIHAHYGLTGAAALMQTQFPVVITYHGSDLLGEVGKQNKYTLSGKIKTVIGQVAGWCAVERIVVADLLKHKLWPKPSVTIPMGVDLSLFRPIAMKDARQQLGFPLDKQFILFAAHPKNPVKRFDIAVEAVSILNQGGQGVELYPLYNIPHDQVPIYMNACDALVLTSMHEASPCVIKEALACNLPVVSVNVGDVSERMAGIEGSYICARKPEDVAQKLRQVLNAPGRPESRPKIAELGLQNIARQVIAVYEHALEKKKSSRVLQ